MTVFGRAVLLAFDFFVRLEDFVPAASPWLDATMKIVEMHLVTRGFLVPSAHRVNECASREFDQKIKKASREGDTPRREDFDCSVFFVTPPLRVKHPSRKISFLTIKNALKGLVDDTSNTTKPN